MTNVNRKKSNNNLNKRDVILLIDDVESDV